MPDSVASFWHYEELWETVFWSPSGAYIAGHNGFVLTPDTRVVHVSIVPDGDPEPNSCHRYRLLLATTRHASRWGTGPCECSSAPTG